MLAATPTPAFGDLASIRALVDDDLAAVDRTIRARLASDIVLVNQVAEHIVGSGGKRLRPLLVLLAARALGYDGDRHVELAVIVEFIHTATLLHDDVVDGSELRRGRSTANALFGNEVAVLVGDSLYTRACEMMVTLGDMRVLQIMARTTSEITNGEVLQLLNRHDPDTTEKSYLEVIHRKTALLFEGCGTARSGLRGCRPGAKRGRDGAVRPAPGHRLSARRRHPRLPGRNGRDRQERGRRPRGRQAHAAPHSRHPGERRKHGPRPAGRGQDPGARLHRRGHRRR